MSGYADLFFMGVAFLLLETKNVVQYALLFGTTWFVNALVFLGILLTVLVAVEVSRRVTFRHPARLYLLLLASLIVAWAVPQSSLLSLAVVPRFLAATSLAFAPVFFANLVFTQRFKSVSASTTAFAANLLGAMVGGIDPDEVRHPEPRVVEASGAGVEARGFQLGERRADRRDPGLLVEGEVLVEGPREGRDRAQRHPRVHQDARRNASSAG